MATSFDADKTRGAVNAWGNSFPAEEIPLGSTLAVGGIPFDLQMRDEAYDHIEALGQTISLPDRLVTTGIALLCFGEMGSQELNVQLYEGDILQRNLSLLGRAWLVETDSPAEEECYLCSHLHYVGGYELSQLRPALWCSRIEWQPAAAVTKIVLGCNPLFHVFAMTCFHES